MFRVRICEIGCILDFFSLNYMLFSLIYFYDYLFIFPYDDDIFFS